MSHNKKGVRLETGRCGILEGNLKSWSKERIPRMKGGQFGSGRQGHQIPEKRKHGEPWKRVSDRDLTEGWVERASQRV